MKWTFFLSAAFDVTCSCTVEMGLGTGLKFNKAQSFCLPNTKVDKVLEYINVMKV